MTGRSIDKEYQMISYTEMYRQYEALYPIESAVIDGNTFQYRLHRGGDITLVFLPGGVGIPDMFASHFMMFAREFSVLVMEYPPECKNNNELANSIAKLFFRLGLRKIVLLGQSYGGFLAQIIARRCPCLVVGMVLSNTGCLSADMEEDSVEMLMGFARGLRGGRRLLKVLPISIFRHMVIKNYEQDLARFMDLGHADEKQYLREQIRQASDKITRKSECQMCELMMDLANAARTTREDYARLKGRCLLVLSPDDSAFPAGVRKALVDQLEGAEVCRGVSGGHMAMFIQIGEYVDAVSDFISKIEPRQGKQSIRR